MAGLLARRARNAWRMLQWRVTAARAHRRAPLYHNAGDAWRHANEIDISIEGGDGVSRRETLFGIGFKP